MELILANKDRFDAIRLDESATIDVEIGGQNDLELKIYRSEYSEIINAIHLNGASAQMSIAGDMYNASVVYSPGTEYGGFLGEINTDTTLDTITFKGYTFRGYLTKKIIEPPQGADYKTVSGELNSVLADLVDEAEMQPAFQVPKTSTGVIVTNFQFDRYCTFLDGVTKMLKSKNYKLKLTYIQQDSSGGIISAEPGYVQIEAVPIVDYSSEIELSQNSRLNFNLQETYNGINRLICLGKGELKDRVVLNLYATKEGEISTIQDTQYTGIGEIAEVYDYSSAEDINALKTAGEEKLKELMNKSAFEMDVETLDIDVNIGDIVGGRDYLTGLYMAKPVERKIWRVENGVPTIEYKLEGQS